jgi:genome maintenance exonuclease 1
LFEEHVFRHELLPVTEIADEVGEHGRYYTTPDGARYPSVTTVIGRAADKTHLEAWRERVGREEAKKVTVQAQVRGRAFHHLAEQFVLNNPRWSEGAMPANVYTFAPLKPILRRHVGTVYGIEFPMWSHRLRTAGRTDLVADWDDVPAIIDFKTSRRPKTEDQIQGYLVQKACYAQMFHERTGKIIERIVTVMAPDHEEPQLWVRDRRDYDNEVRRIFADRRWDADPGILLPGGVRPEAGVREA